MDQDASFGRLLRRLRKARDLTQEALAQQAYYTVDTIKKIEAGLRRPSRQLAAQFADCLELEGDERAAFLAAARAIIEPETDVPVEMAALGAGAPAPSTPAPHSKLPHQATLFVGRAAELSSLARLLDQPHIRLISITGAGGMGKTRLAIALAEQLLAVNRFPDGVFFVSLAPVEAVVSIVSALAEGLEFPLDAGKQPARSSRQQVFDYLREKRLLLILDNVEQLLSGAEASVSDAADLVATLLSNAPGVAVLATSRERLKLHTEQVYLLGGLDVSGTEDPSDSSAVALFIQSARRLRPEFAPARGQLDVVARICHLVEGMPLAIELAAGWVDTLALPDIATEIERGLDLLATALRDVPVRHRSMRAVFDASWRRLGAAEQAVFDRLAVFRGGGTRHAVQAVTQATLPQLHALVGASLMHCDVARDRYSVHELLRQYAAEQLAADPTEEHATRDRHAAYFCGLLRDLRGDLQGERQLQALATIEADGENVRAAWEWAARQGNAALIDQAIDSLGYFYQWQGRAEEGVAAYRLAAAALAAASTLDAQRVRAQLLAWQAAYAQLLGERATAEALLAQSQDLLNDPDLVDISTHAARAFVLLQAGHLAVEHDPPAARQAYEESRTLFQALGDHWGEAAALFGLGLVTLNWSSDYDLAQRYLLDSLALCRTLAAQLSTIETLVIVSNNARYRGQVAESVQLARESYELSITLGNQRAIAIAGSNLGIALSWNGNYAESRRLLQETVAIYTDLGDRAGLANAYYRLGWSQVFPGRYPEARATFECGLSISRTIGATLDTGGCLSGLAAIALAEGAYSETQRRGAEAISLLDVVGERWYVNWTYVLSALAERGLGNQREARRQVITALRSLLEQRTWLITFYALRTIGLLLADDEEPERAVELYALTEREETFRDSSWSFAVWRRELAAIAAMLPANVAAAAEARGRARDLWATVEELLVELS
ncbi:MAG TPA: tetratricopeptide repeat protein, partial [Roseiflexaceae bacterium]